MNWTQVILHKLSGQTKVESDTLTFLVNSTVRSLKWRDKIRAEVYAALKAQGVTIYRVDWQGREVTI